MQSFTACLTIDVEHDCPPFLRTYRGIEEGLPRLLAFLEEEGIVATFFTTGDVATRYSNAIGQIVAAGHELGCHGFSHQRFDSMCWDEAEREIREATILLRSWYPVTSFRAPNLSFPPAYLPILAAQGYRLDSSQAKYKPSHWWRWRSPTPLKRVPASMTSSVLRLPYWLRRLVMLRLISPVVFFVHPWEFVDLRRAPIRFDCRFRTGDVAFECLQTSVHLLRERGAEFVRMQDLAN